MRYETDYWPEAPCEYPVKGDKLRLVAICDPHLSAFDPASYKVSYWDLTKGVLRSVFDYAVKINADGVVFAGDVFHLKSAQRNPTWFMAEVIELFTEYQNKGIPIFGIAGNHDIKFGTVENGLWGQPLDLLIKAGVYHLLDRKEIIFRHAATPYWEIKLAGASYRHGYAHTARDKTRTQSIDKLITVGHFWYGAQSGDFFGEPIFGPDYLGAGATDLYVIGHHHEDQGCTEVGGKQYLSPGSMSRTGSHKHDLERRPSASFIEADKDGIVVKIIRPSVPPPEEIMDLEKRAQVSQEHEELNQFIAAMSSVKITSSDPKQLLEELSPTQQVKERVLKYLAEAEIE